jgi:hypothetical protein
MSAIYYILYSPTGFLAMWQIYSSLYSTIIGKDPLLAAKLVIMYHHSFIILSLYFFKRIRIIKSRMMRWAGHVAQMGEKRNVYKLLQESQRERDH